MKDKILAKIKRDGEARVADFVKQTGFTRAYIQRFFKELVDSGQIVRIGQTRNARYVMSETVESVVAETTEFTLRLKNIDLSEDKVLDQIKRETAIFVKLPRNVTKIVDFAFTEVLNNAIEHSLAPNIVIRMTRSNNILSFSITDNGIGIFQNIMNQRGLDSLLDAIRELMKGKQTTLPEAHSGQGLFFTSRLADKLIIYGSNYKLIFNNIIDDVFLEGAKNRKGTKVQFEIGTNSKTVIKTVFDRYTEPEQFEFDKTEINVKMYKLDTDLISRSQARRLLANLDDFQTIVLDFREVKAIGQGFADEIFRVWKTHNKEKIISAINANEEVLFMIKHAGEY